MLTETRGRLEGSATARRTDPRPDYFELGVDADGCRHVVDTTTETIHIIRPDGGRGRRVIPATKSLDDYMCLVETEGAGWRHPKYGVSIIEQLGQALQSGEEAR